MLVGIEDAGRTRCFFFNPDRNDLLRFIKLSDVIRHNPANLQCNDVLTLLAGFRFGKFAMMRFGSDHQTEFLQERKALRDICFVT